METVYRPEKDVDPPHNCYPYDLEKMVYKNQIMFHEVKRCECGQLWIAVSGGYDDYWLMKPLRWYHKVYWKIDRSEA